MTTFGYTLMCERSRPDLLVRDAQAAESAGFEFALISDHDLPWLEAQGHSGYAWSILGAVAHATTELSLMAYVTCPATRYHPTVVAQKAATVQILSDGRFRLGLGTGENLNEHAVGGRWPIVGARRGMLSEAVDIIGALFDGDVLNHRGEHYAVEHAKLWDLHDVRVPIGLAVSGPESCALAGAKTDLMIAVEPKAELCRLFDAAGGTGKPRVGQIAVSYDPDRETAVGRAHEQFRWFSLGWKVNAELPLPESFDAAAQSVTPEEVSQQLPCGDDVGEFVTKIRPFLQAGFTEVALCQVGDEHQTEFIRWAEAELLPALRDL